MMNDFDELAEIASKKDPDLTKTNQANVCSWCGETFHHVGYPYGSEFIMCSLACFEEFKERKR